MILSPAATKRNGTITKIVKISTISGGSCQCLEQMAVGHFVITLLTNGSRTNNSIDCLTPASSLLRSASV